VDSQQGVLLSENDCPPSDEPTTKKQRLQGSTTSAEPKADKVFTSQPGTTDQIWSTLQEGD